MNYLVEMKNVKKIFPGVVALDNVSFQLMPGEVHALLGENGAGKSTLMKILSGIYAPSSGTIALNGKEYEKLTPNESAENKISIIYQELSVIDELSIGENIFVGRLPTKQELLWKVIDSKYIMSRAKELLNRVGLDKDPSVIVKNLSISEKQQVEIAKAISQDAKIIIMDEPTSSLTQDETEKLFVIINNLKKEGTGIVYITHKLKEINQIADRVTVIKDGKYVGTKIVKDTVTSDLITMMVGRECEYIYEPRSERHYEEGILLKVQNLTRLDKKVNNVSFELNRGEILGFAGLIGAGRTELMNAIFGADKISTGELYLNGKKLKINNPYNAIKYGLAMVTESRRESGFFPNFQVWSNISILPSIKDSKLLGVWGQTNAKKEKKIALEQKTALNIKCSSIEQSIIDLSGGNQQKVIIGKWLAAKSNIFILDEPTRGIDVGAKCEIYGIMRNLVKQGKGVIMVSSELPELLAMCDRIIVFGEGRIKGILSNTEASEERIMHIATTSE